MPTAEMHRMLCHLRSIAPPRERNPGGDADLLERFLDRRDELAFADLVRRHGPMVLGVCRRILGNAHDTEDAFQATFLVLARKASSIRPPSNVGPWLHGVARRTASKARVASLRRRRAEARAAEGRTWAIPPHVPDCLSNSLLDEALAQLPDKYRAPLVLCLLQGRSRKEAAALLGWSEGTLSGRLARAKALLGDRLARRGLTPELARGAFTFLVSPSLVTATAQAALSVSGTTAPVVSTPVLILAEEVITNMLTSKCTKAVALLTVVAGLTFGTGAIAWHAGPASDTLPTHPRLQVKALAPPAYLIEPPDLLKVEYSHPDTDHTVEITGPRLVRPDGTIGLGRFGAIQVSGLSLAQARRAVSRHLGQRLDRFDPRHLTLELVESNSKFVYVIVEGEGNSQVHRVPLKAAQTVLDVLNELDKVDSNHSRLAQKRIHIERPSATTPGASPEKLQILPVDYKGITREGLTATNYLLLPGDRIRVAPPPGRIRVPVDAAKLEKLPRPTEKEVIEALPKDWSVAPVKAITFELPSHELEPARWYPLVGYARLARLHWKCTVYGERKIAVVYLDRDHLIPGK